MKCSRCKMSQPEGIECIQCGAPLQDSKDQGGLSPTASPSSGSGEGLSQRSEGLSDFLSDLGLGDAPFPAQPSAQAASEPVARTTVTTPPAPSPKPGDLPTSSPPKKAEPATVSHVEPPKPGPAPAAAPSTPTARADGGAVLPLTTGPDIPGRTVWRVVGVVTAQVAVRVEGDVLPPGAPVCSLAGTGMGAHLDSGLSTAFTDLKARAAQAGGNAVVSVTVGYHPGVGGALMISVAGTAVELAP